MRWTIIKLSFCHQQLEFHDNSQMMKTIPNPLLGVMLKQHETVKKDSEISKTGVT